MAPPRPFSNECLLTGHIDHLLQQDVIEKVSHHGPGRSFPFVIPKRDGGSRFLVDFSHLTPLVCKRPITMYPFHMTMVRRVWLPHYRAVKVDLADAFYSVPMHPSSRFLTEFAGPDGSHYRFKRLPMGLSTSPQILQRITREILKPIASLVPIAWVHLDDFLLVGPRSKVKLALLRLRARLKAVNFSINVSKSVLRPVQQLTFCGVSYDLRRREAFPAPGPLQALQTATPQICRRYPDHVRGLAAWVLSITARQYSLLGLDPEHLVPALLDLWRKGWLRTALHGVPQSIVFFDATPTTVGIRTCDEAFVFRLPFPLHQAHAESVALITASMFAHPGDILAGDALAALGSKRATFNLHEYLQLRSRGFRIMYVPSCLNPADAPSRFRQPNYIPQLPCACSDSKRSSILCSSPASFPHSPCKSPWHLVQALSSDSNLRMDASP